MLHAISPLAAASAGAVGSAPELLHAPAALSTPAGAGETIALRLGREIEAARSLECEARDALHALQRGDRTDVEGVLLATRKADAAFQMLQAVRNAMLEAYAEIRDMRV